MRAMLFTDGTPPSSPSAYLLCGLLNGSTDRSRALTVLYSLYVPSLVIGNLMRALKSKSTSGPAKKLSKHAVRATGVVIRKKMKTVAATTSRMFVGVEPTRIPKDIQQILLSAYNTFVAGRADADLVQRNVLRPQQALSAGELAALDAVGFGPVKNMAKRAERARERSLGAFFNLVANSDNTRGVAKRLGVDESRIRQRIRERSLLAIDVDGEHKIPMVQFERDREIPGLKAVLAALPSGLPALAFASWFVSPKHELAQDDDDATGLSPRDWLLTVGDPEPVVAMARDL